MKKDNLIKGAAVFGALALMAGGVVAADAATNRSFTNNLNKDGNFEHGRMMGQGNGLGKNASSTEVQKAREDRQAEMETRKAGVEAAIKAGSYTDWVAAMGTDNPIITKVTEANFAEFSRAHNLMEEARAIFESIGVDNGNGNGAGMGRGLGLGHMFNK